MEGTMRAKGALGGCIPGEGGNPGIKDRKSMGGGRREGRRQDSWGDDNWENWKIILAALYCIIFYNKKSRPAWEHYRRNWKRENKVWKTGSSHPHVLHGIPFNKPPPTPLLKLLDCSFPPQKKKNYSPNLQKYQQKSKGADASTPQKWIAN